MANTYSLDLEVTSSQYAYGSDSASLSITQSFTLECNVNIESLSAVAGNYNVFLSKYTVAGDKRSYFFGMQNLDGSYYLATNISSDGTFQADNKKTVAFSPSLSTWYHVALVYDHTGPSYKFYVNGSQQGTTQTPVATSISNNDSAFCIGTLDYPTGISSYLYDGKIDDVRVWNYARTEAQIAANYQRELAGNETGLVLYAKCNEGSGTTLYDSTSNGNNLTLSGSPSFSSSVPFADTTTTSTSTSSSTTTTSTSTSTTTTSTSTSTTTTSTSTTTTSTSTSSSTSTSTTVSTTSTSITTTSTTYPFEFIVERV